MTISYNWISEYIPERISHERISNILTSIGLEVEAEEQYENFKGGLAGLVVGEVKECIQHPGADKLKLTKVDTGDGEWLQIVCGAPNVAVGQKVIVAPIGSTIYPLKGEPVTMKKARIRGEESFGMICAEDEVGLGDSHDGIVILPDYLKAGTPLSRHIAPYTDYIFEIGLTPNRMDAMSHYGVARDVCAYLAHHEGREIKVKTFDSKKVDTRDSSSFEVVIENKKACKRYCGVSITGITVKPSPQWLQDKLKAIGQRPINNIVDITNYILHDAGQPLHAFDADKVAGRKIVVKNLSEGSLFRTLDGKDRKLSSEDLMICDGSEKGMCIAGVFGGINSGVTEKTKSIFLESAWFNPVDIRKTSFRHGLRTDAAMRFEKNVDISSSLNVLKRAASLIAEIAGGTIEGSFIDVYPEPEDKKLVKLNFDFLSRLSGKKYEETTAVRILESLGFEVYDEGVDPFINKQTLDNKSSVVLKVPYSKPDIEVQADIVEEIMRIDGYDNIQIPASISITPSVGSEHVSLVKKEKIADYLVGAGFSEIFTNSITNAAYFEDSELKNGVRLLNNLSAVHNIMRPSMLETTLESVAYNLNRKNSDLRFFEFGKTYHAEGVGTYLEDEHLYITLTGDVRQTSWNEKSRPADIYYLKGIVEAVLKYAGVVDIEWRTGSAGKLKDMLTFKVGERKIVELGSVVKKELGRFDIRQEVFIADIRWNDLSELAGKREVRFSPLPNQLPVYRDLAMVVPNTLPFSSVTESLQKIKLDRLKAVNLFDVFESDKIGKDKKSLAINLTFIDEQKTLSDQAIDSMMNTIMQTLEQELKAEIRKGS
jgi:phenylalanyl-tRNA synthetase beta chain